MTSRWAFLDLVAARAWVAQHPIPPPADDRRCPNLDADLPADELHACDRCSPRLR